MQLVSTVPDTEVTKLSLPALLSQVCSCSCNLVFSICKIRANLCVGRESKNYVFLRTLLVKCKKENKTTKKPIWLQVDNSYRQNISGNNCINKENLFCHQTQRNFVFAHSSVHRLTLENPAFSVSSVYLEMHAFVQYHCFILSEMLAILYTTSFIAVRQREGKEQSG